ncbi:hypothetical protein BDN72DRAFT_905188 [Pluteus cervinus]|uniref:Uncharacterized protein n=1 Tax=Pluteus cervinus TaxID=181527 RepID=A0ACD3A5T0_9AGAR|nr:hypothetical protein BDN72DRAFT_905188 [Pluteus cervinus]
MTRVIFASSRILLSYIKPDQQDALRSQRGVLLLVSAVWHAPGDPAAVQRSFFDAQCPPRGTITTAIYASNVAQDYLLAFVKNTIIAPSLKAVAPNGTGLKTAIAELAFNLIQPAKGDPVIRRDNQIRPVNHILCRGGGPGCLESNATSPLVLSLGCIRSTGMTRSAFSSSNIPNRDSIITQGSDYYFFCRRPFSVMTVVVTMCSTKEFP